MTKLETKSTLILIAVTAVWGLTFPLIESAVDYISPTAFVLVRMIIASIGFLPFIYKRFWQTNYLLIWGGLVLACLNAVTYLFQTEGLQTIPASRSAFITGFNVVLVPLLAPLFRLGIPKGIEITAAILCLIGLYILTGANLHHLSIGDLWSLACAISYALLVVSLQVILKYTTENLLLSFYATLFGVLIPLLFLPRFNGAELLHWQVILALFFCALIATSFVTYLMACYQQHIQVTRVAIIYALEPVFATVFAFLLYHQSLGINTILGGMIIFISIILPVIKLKSTPTTVRLVPVINKEDGAKSSSGV